MMSTELLSSGDWVLSYWLQPNEDEVAALMRRRSAALAIALLVVASTTSVATELDIDRQNDPIWSQARVAISERDFESALPMLLDLADRGSRRAALFLGNIYGQGFSNQPANFEEARSWWRIAATKGLAQAQYNLAASYLRGDGTPVDREQAIRWLREAADRGHGKAMLAIGEEFLTDSNRALHPEGYMYLRIAHVSEGLSARTTLGRSLQGTIYVNDPIALTALRVAAVSKLWATTLVDSTNPLHRVSVHPMKPFVGPEVYGPSADRDERLAYLIDFQLRTLFGMQDRIGHPTDTDHTAKTPDSFSDVVERNSEMYAKLGQQFLGRPAFVYPFFVTGTRAEMITAAYLPADVLWSIARPSDFVLISDLFSHHMTSIFRVDRSNDVVAFLDVWPDEFMLREGFNLVDARAEIEPEGISRRLVTVNREEFQDVIKGLSIVGDEDFPAMLMAAYPETATDWRVRLAVGSALMRPWRCEYLSAALGHLLEAASLIENRSVESNAESKLAIADRVTVAKGLATVCGHSASDLGIDAARLSMVPEGSMQTLANDEFEKLFSALLAAEQFDTARKMTERSLEDDPMAPEGNVMLGLIQTATGKPEEAETSFGKAIDRLETLIAQDFDQSVVGLVEKANRDRWPSLLSLSYEQRGRARLDVNPDQAYQDAERAIALEPSNAALRLGIAAAQALGKNDRMEELKSDLAEREAQSLISQVFGFGRQ